MRIPSLVHFFGMRVTSYLSFLYDFGLHSCTAADATDASSTHVVLNARGYTGDGFWSTGHKLSGEATAPRVLADEELPENLCGGTYRKAKRVRRKLTYAEQKQRRKERKFGKSEGDSLGVDQRERAKLEHKSGKKAKDTTVKPRVAQSSRGRELRAQAALARLEAASQKAPPGPSSRKKEEDEDEEETEEDEDEYQEEEEGGAIDFGHGERVVKMEDGEDDNAGDEWEELQRQMRGLCATTSGAANGIAGTGAGPSRSNGGAPAPGKGTSNGSNDTQKNLDSYGARPETKSVDHQGRPSRSIIELDSDDEATEDDDTPPPPPDRPFRPPSASTGKKVSPQDKPSSTPQLRPASALPGKVASADLMSPSDSTSRACSVCTVDNPPQNATCHVCACVLDPRRTPSWLCTSKNCRSLGYAVREGPGFLFYMSQVLTAHTPI